MIAGLLVVIAISGFEVGKFIYNLYNANEAEKAISDIVHDETIELKEEPKEKAPCSFDKDKWNKLHEMNNDFVGWMAFDDEWISEPIVQGKDNEYYLTHYIDGTYSEAGTVFVDAQNTAGADQNVTMYGHHVFYNDKEKLSPLLKLVNQEEFDKHNTFKIWYEDYVAEYEITNVYKISEEDKIDFKQSNFYDDEDFQSYVDYINANNLVTTENNLSRNSRFITLQTCQTVGGEILFVVTCKEKTRTIYE